MIFAIMMLATLLMSSARAWMRGSDRAMCIMNIQAVQKGVRGYANMTGVGPGENVSGLESKVVGAGQFFMEIPECPAKGSYTLDGDLVPEIGTLYMTCSLSLAEGHEPVSIIGW